MTEIQTEEQKIPETPVQIAKPKTPSNEIQSKPWSDLPNIEPLPITIDNNRLNNTKLNH